MEFIKGISKKYLYAVLAAAVMAAAAYLLAGGGKRETHEYTYGTYVESKLADDVAAYLSGVGGLDEADRAAVADYSVQTYNMVLRSGADAITDEHSAALAAMFRDKLSGYNLADTDISALSDGISSYVWQAVLLSLNISDKKGDVAPEQEAEYLRLAESLQAQIDALEEKRMNIHITARLKDDAAGTAAAAKETEAVFTKYVNGVLDTVNTDFDKKFDDIESDIDSSLDSRLSGIKSDITSELKSDMTSDVNKKMDSMKSDITSEITRELKDSIKNGADGKEGKAGAAGKDGKDGKDGRNGEDGEDGKSTYIAYADDASGGGFSLAPTETSKYIGTCVTASDRQPENPSDYNWQLYRSYIITSVTDDDNNTTLYIK